MTVQQRPNYYIAANFKYKYQAVKAFHTVKDLLLDDRPISVFLTKKYDVPYN